MKRVHVHVHSRDATSEESVKSQMSSVRQSLMPLSSKLASVGSSSDNLKLKNACFKAEELVDQARRVLFDAV